MIRYFKDGPGKYILSLKTVFFHCNNEDRHAQILTVSLDLEFWGGCWIFGKFMHASFWIRTVPSFFSLECPFPSFTILSVLIKCFRYSGVPLWVLKPFIYTHLQCCMICFWWFLWSLDLSFLYLVTFENIIFFFNVNGLLPHITIHTPSFWSCHILTVYLCCDCVILSLPGFSSRLWTLVIFFASALSTILSKFIQCGLFSSYCLSVYLLATK